jgi:hypothetical protein
VSFGWNTGVSNNVSWQICVDFTQKAASGHSARPYIYAIYTCKYIHMHLRRQSNVNSFVSESIIRLFVQTYCMLLPGPLQ